VIQYYYGQIAELFLIPSISTEDLQFFQGWLYWKWGLQALLASDHPYKSAAPTIVEPQYLNLEAPVPESYILMTSIMSIADEAPAPEENGLFKSIISVDSISETSDIYCDTVVTNLCSINSIASRPDTNILSASNIVSESPAAQDDCVVVNPTAINIQSVAPRAETSIAGVAWQTFSIAQSAPVPEIQARVFNTNIIDISTIASRPDSNSLVIAEKYCSIASIAPCSKEEIIMTDQTNEEIVKFDKYRYCNL